MPICRYTGIDVFPDESYINDENEKFVIAEPEKFDAAIAGEGRRFDAVISRHNLEHCNDRDKTLAAMLDTVIPGATPYQFSECGEREFSET